MSNLVAQPGQSPDPQSGSKPAVETVHVRDLGGQSPPGGGDEIDLLALWRALRRRKKVVIVTASIVAVLSALNTFHQRIYNPVFQGSFTLLITDPISSESGGGGGRGAPGSMFEALARNTTSNDIPTLIEVLRSPVLLAPIAEKFGLSPGGLGGQISIATGGGRDGAEGVLNVSLTGRDPEEAQRLLEALSHTYLQAALQQRQQRLADGIAFLNKQAPTLETRTQELQSQLAAFRERHSLLEPTDEGVALKHRVVEMDTLLMQLEADRARLEKVRWEIASGTISARGFQEAISTGGGGGGLSVTQADQSLLNQLLEVETELAEARSKYNSNSSMVQGLEARLRQLQPMLRQNQLEAVDTALALNGSRLATAQLQQRALTGQFLKQPALIKQYDALQQKLKIAQENLAGLASARETFQLEMAQRSVPWRVIAPPSINPNPIKPSVPSSIATGLVLGLVAGAGAGLLRDRLDHVFHHPGEVNDELGLPLLGHVPHVSFLHGVREGKRFLLEELEHQVSEDGGDPDALKQRRYQRFFYQEALRNLFTSLRFLNSDLPLKSVALTSSVPAEGKSLVNVLLAKTLSEMGQRVLLIDADLRKPQMHHRLGINNLTGLSNLLADDGKHWRQVLQTVPGYDNWSVISAGRRPPDPTRLLSSQRMHQLVAELTSCGDYDLVLFDTPPVLGLADAALVAEHCDGLMLLVSLGRVDRGLPRESVNRIRSSGAPLLGIVTNSVREANQGGNTYSYGYGKYGYGYGYGYGGAYGYGGYGYAAYDTSATYAYYGEFDPSDEATGAAKATPSKPGVLGSSRGSDNNRWQNWRKDLQQQKRRLIRWLDS